MTILPRYFLRIFLPVFVLCLAVFTGVLLMNQFLRLFNMAIMKGISPLWIAACFARLLPYLCSLAVPMAYLVALLITLAQLAEGGEVMALRASGFSFVEMTWPFLAVAVLASGLLLYLNHKASPEGFHSFRNRYAEAAHQLSRVEVEPRTLLSLGGWSLYARAADNETGRLEGVYLVRREAGVQGLRIDAQKGQLHVEKGKGLSLELYDGDLLLPSTDPDRLTSGHFKRYRIELPLSGGLAAARAPDIQEMRSTRLEALIADPATTPQHRMEYRVEIAVRSAAALSPFVFFWIAAPLGIQFGRMGRGTGFAMSLGVLFAFYGFLAVGIGLGRRHAALSGIAPWLADVAGIVLGGWITRRAVAK